MKVFAYLGSGLLLFFGMTHFGYGQDVIDPSTVDGATVTIESFAKDTLSLVTNLKGMTGLAIASGVLSLVLKGLNVAFVKQLFKTDKAKNIRRTILLISGAALATIGYKVAGQSIADALISGGVTSGFALAIYHAIKGLIPSKSA